MKQQQILGRMKKILIFVLLFNSAFVGAQVKYSKNDQGDNIITGAGTPSTNSVTATTGSEYKNTTTGDKYTAVSSAWTANAYVAAWSSTTTITIGAVTTPPTKATTVQNDFVRYRIKNQAIGATPALITADYVYSATSNVGTAGGTGNYLFTLPNSYQFNSTEHSFYTGTTDLSDGSMSIYALGRGAPYGMAYGDGFYDFVLIVPYDATRFRIISLGGNASDEWIGSGWYPITQNTKVYSFLFDFYAQ